MKRIAILSAAAVLLGSAFSVAPISSADAQNRYVAPPSTRLAAPPSRFAAPPSRLAAPPPRIVATPQTGARLIGNDGSTFRGNGMVAAGGGNFRR